MVIDFFSLLSKKKLFGNVLVFNLIKNQISTVNSSRRMAENKQQLKIDITSDNICRE
jgi:hypothetical protein